VQGDLQALCREGLNAVADHFERAQDAGSDDGLASFHLVDGWSSSYPETTGYIIPTLLSMAEVLERPKLTERAMRAADWLLSVQHADGGWPGGRIGEQRPSVVFNTAQVVRGMLAAHARSGDPRYLQAADRACTWIAQVQEGDGGWAKHNFLGVTRVYDAYVDAPLLHMYRISANEHHREAARRNLELVLGRQLDNGWFADADNTVKHNDRPITHTMAYTLDGLLESHRYHPDERFVDAARKAADVLLDRFLATGTLHGRYDADWRGSEATISTGCMQLAVVWARLHAHEGGEHYAHGLERMLRWGLAVQHRSSQGPIEMHGALTGSVPVWGRYEKFACPNWAQKYFADALLCAMGRPPHF
jgi:uncharacterized protein YyaL (SSP411 family)